MRLSLLLALVLALPLAGCKAKPAADSGFLGSRTKKLAKHDDYPFHRAWFAKGWNGPAYKTLVVKPVSTKYIAERPDWAKINTKAVSYEKDVANLAVYTQEKFQVAFREDKKKRFQVVDKARGDSLILELALVEVRPNEAVLGALGLATTMVGGSAIASVAQKETGKGRVAIEGRVRRAKDGRVVAMFADAEHGKFGPINVRRAMWYGEAHKVVKEWAAQWVKIANADSGEAVGDTQSFTLRPW